MTSFPPVDKKSPQPAQAQPASAAREPEKKDKENPQLIHILYSQAEINRRERDETINKLNDPYKADALNFLKEINEIKELLSNLVKNNQSIKDKKKPTAQERQKYDTLSKQINEKINEVAGRFKKYKFFRDFLTDLINYKTEEEELFFYVEATLTSTINSIYYLQEVEKFINENKNKIIKKFGPKDITSDLYQSITFSIELSKFETHHSGKSPAFVIFKHNGRELFKIVYKPRKAVIDKAVLSTFKKINKLKAVEDKPPVKSDTVDLPHYKIWIPSKKTNVSIWEYVEGNDVKSKSEPRNVKIFLEQELQEGSNQLKQALKTLYRLDAILSRMDISDLHNDNLKVKNLKDKTKEVQIIPIDLENRQKGEGTFLGVKSDSFKLTEAEEKIIKKYFTDKVASVSVRYLPIGTERLMILINDYRTCEDAAQLIMQQLQAQKFQMKCSLKDLTILTVKSFFKHDIPYFTNIEGKIYYGLLEEGNLIAEIRR